MKPIIITFIIIVFLPIIYGCRVENQSVRESEILYDEWIKEWGVEYPICFNSNYGVEDTLMTTLVFNRFNEGTNDIMEDSRLNARGDCGYEFIITSGYQTMKGYFYFGLYGDTLAIDTQVDGLTHHSERYPFNPTNIGESYDLYGLIVPDCIVADSTNSQYSTPYNAVQNRVDKYVFSKEFGLLYYRFEDGEEFIQYDRITPPYDRSLDYIRHRFPWNLIKDI